jgi:GNAT superfamily N-acetyltransferase
MNNNYLISTDKKLFNPKKTTELLRGCFWATNITQERVEKLIINSLCFGVFKKEDLNQIGFARVITDFLSYAYLCDVVIDPSYRNLGLGTYLINQIFSFEDLLGIETWTLRATEQSLKIYQSLGFKIPDDSTIRLELNSKPL